jgi:hypothetical protein
MALRRQASQLNPSTDGNMSPRADKKRVSHDGTVTRSASMLSAVKPPAEKAVVLESIVPNFVSNHIKSFCSIIGEKYASLGTHTPAVSSKLSSQTDAANLPQLPLHLSGLESNAYENFAAVVMADVSGYSKLSAELAERGPKGAELLSQAMKGYLDQIIDIILMHGGDIVKFAGIFFIDSFFQR